MPDCIDAEARAKLGDLKADFVTLATDYWGKDGTNGHRSRSVGAQKRLEVLEHDLGHYLDKKRGANYRPELDAGRRDE